jgi:predicted metal-dependent hydrolase
MKKKIILNSREFEYFLTRKKVKNINLRIKPDGKLYVSANIFVSAKAIESFLVSNADKIIKTVDRFSEKQKSAPLEKNFKNGEIFSVLGVNKTLSVVESKKNKAEVVGDALLIHARDTNDIELKNRIFESLKKSLCEEVIKEICDRFYPIFAWKGVAYPTLKFRKMKSRWGSCQPKKGILTFNTKLAEFPIEAIEFVVMHEFTHFLHPDHSKSFYTTLASLMPDWKERKQLL